MFKKLFFLPFFLLCFNAYSLSFTDIVINENYKLYNKIVKMPFTQEIFNGTLSEEKFKYFIIQDCIFLNKQKDVYEILLSKNKNKEIHKLLTHIIDKSQKEYKSIVNTFFTKFNITEADINNAKSMPVTELYINFLIKKATYEPIEVAMSSLMPCYFIYSNIWNNMAKNKKYDKKYSVYIQQYTRKKTSSSFDKLSKILNVLYEKTSLENKKKMKNTYKEIMEMEYRFFNAAYNKVIWI